MGTQIDGTKNTYKVGKKPCPSKFLVLVLLSHLLFLSKKKKKGISNRIFKHSTYDCRSINKLDQRPLKNIMKEWVLNLTVILYIM